MSIYEILAIGLDMKTATKIFAREYWQEPRKIRLFKMYENFATFRVVQGTHTYIIKLEDQNYMITKE